MEKNYKETELQSYSYNYTVSSKFVVTDFSTELSPCVANLVNVSWYRYGGITRFQITTKIILLHGSYSGVRIRRLLYGLKKSQLTHDIRIRTKVINSVSYRINGRCFLL